MRRSIPNSLIIAFTILGAYPSFASEYPGDKVLAIDLLDDSCITSSNIALDNSSQATVALPCEQLPVAFDLRFLDDDHNNTTYDLPVALDLDWESGEP